MEEEVESHLLNVQGSLKESITIRQTRGLLASYLYREQNERREWLCRAPWEGKGEAVSSLQRVTALGRAQGPQRNLRESRTLVRALVRVLVW